MSKAYYDYDDLDIDETKFTEIANNGTQKEALGFVIQCVERNKDKISEFDMNCYYSCVLGVVTGGRYDYYNEQYWLEDFLKIKRRNSDGFWYEMEEASWFSPKFKDTYTPEEWDVVGLFTDRYSQILTPEQWLFHAILIYYKLK